MHIVEDKSLAKGERNSMLKDLGVLVKVGQHANIAGIIGVCEETETMVIAMEHYGMNLKEFLLNSRALNNYPSYATKEQRFSTLHEAQAIDIALGIAKGMAYLQSLSALASWRSAALPSSTSVLITASSAPSSMSLIRTAFWLMVPPT